MVNDLFEMQLRIHLVKRNRVSSLWASSNPIFASGLIFVHVQEKINILFSVSSNYFLLYFDICLNMQCFVYSKVYKYLLGLHRNKHVLTKCSSYLSAVQWFYIKHGPIFHLISKLDVYLSMSRVSKIFTSDPWLSVSNELIWIVRSLLLKFSIMIVPPLSWISCLCSPQIAEDWCLEPHIISLWEWTKLCL